MQKPGGDWLGCGGGAVVRLLDCTDLSDQVGGAERMRVPERNALGGPGRAPARLLFQSRAQQGP